MEELRIEAFSHEVWEAISDLVTDRNKCYEDMFRLIENEVADEAKRNEFFLLCNQFASEMFNFGFFQGTAWSKGGGVS